jgi:hypothetical protein
VTKSPVTVQRKFRNYYVKGKVFLTSVLDITISKARITGHFATTTEDMLENKWREIYHQLDVLWATKGAHVEVY